MTSFVDFTGNIKTCLGKPIIVFFAYNDVRERSNQAVTISNLFSGYFFYISAFGGLSVALFCRKFSDTEIYFASSMCKKGTKKIFLYPSMCKKSTKKNFLYPSLYKKGIKKNFLAPSMYKKGIKKNFLAPFLGNEDPKKNFLVPSMCIEGLYMCILAYFGQILINNIHN